ncbi:hypothetical protein PSI23_10895 [Xenorhabdus sp. XENO-10]|uniref:Uncharacterized protein n=1 Tax=Xenorhabdus yunnanensis TaxID=3025878 RepID=A0ABT5LFL2_9GAMM|nr:hypothetical protein [Xenorhabdus yunnanensis]MDC9589790.1 hypothetical protein [Xenorhabdus yunnanensis]
MKMKLEHYQELKRLYVDTIKSVTSPDEINLSDTYDRYLEQVDAPNEQCKNIRLRWHFYFIAINKPGIYSDYYQNGRSGFRGILYSYLNDDNIDTALKKIVTELNFEQS